MFLPGMLGGLALAAAVALTGLGSGLSRFLFIWGGLAFAFFSVIMPFKVTRNYFVGDAPRKTRC
jgi:hypothetical protein